MPVIDVDGKRISYWIGKSGASPGRETLLFIHGAGGGAFTWVYQKGFFDREFSPVILELPGHGESGGEGEDDIGRYAGQVHAFAMKMGFQGLFLVGHSMGGAIVQTLALAHPELMKGIVLAGTGAKLKVVPWVLEGLQGRFEETVGKITRFAYSPNAASDLIERGTEQLKACRPGVLYGDFLACDRFDIRQEVARIGVPALIICGEEDALTPVRYSEFLHGQIKGSKLDIIRGAGHMVMMEAPEAFNQKIREFAANPTGSENS